MEKYIIKKKYLIDIFGYNTVDKYLDSLKVIINNAYFDNIYDKIKFPITYENTYASKLCVSFIEFFNSNINILDKMNIDIFNKCYITYYLTNSDKMKNLSIENINNFNKYYLNSLKCILYNMDVNKIKDTISKIYFERDINSFRERINSVKKINITYNLGYEDIIDDISDIFDIYSIDDGITYLSNIDSKMSMYKTIDERCFKICSKDLVNNISIKVDRGVTKLNGENFSIFIHKLRDCIYPDKKYSLIKAVDDKFNVETNDIICLSYINQNQFGTIVDSGSILGFNTIKKDDIIDISPTDCFSNKLIYSMGIVNNRSNSMTSEELIRNTNNYNEIVVKKNNIIPNYVVSLDNVSEEDKKISNYYDLPIIVIPIELYIEKIYKKILYLESKLELDEIPHLLLNMYGSMNGNIDLINKYFSNSNIEKEIFRIIGIIKNLDDKNIEKVIKILDSYELINTYKKISGINDNFDSKILIKKIKKEF